MLRAVGLTKRYGGATALDGISLEIATGEVVGLIGENGAGKSTLIKILSGLVQPDSGQIFLDGQPRHRLTPKESEALGISVIHQERHILENLTVAENICLGREPRRGPFIDGARTRDIATAALARMGLDIDPATLGGRLSNAERQLVEIARALSMSARLIIMDEPTSSLSASETDRLLAIVADLKSKGTSVLYVSHRLGEIVQIADRVTALRDGRHVGDLPRSELTSDAMVRLMVGRDVFRADRPQTTRGSVVLDVKDLASQRYPGSRISFQAHAGEILGIAGLVGSGRSEVLRCLFGIDHPAGGTVTLDGQPLPGGKPMEAIRRGLFLAPEDRRRQGVILDHPILDNICLPSIPHGPMGLVDEGSCREVAERQQSAMAIKCSSLLAPVGSLSGGNQQKVVLARWLALNARCILFDEPTCGIDVGTRAEIYEIMRSLAGQGAAVIIVSSDIEEIITQSDRVLVFCQGRISGELKREELTEEAIMTLAVSHG